MDRRSVADHESLTLLGYFDSRENAAAWLRSGLFSLPDPVFPTHFGESERTAKKRSNQVRDADAFGRFLKKHKGGGFLFGNRLTIQVALYDNVPSEVAFWASENDATFVQHAEAILETLDLCGVAYAHAGSSSEYAERNQYVIRFVDGGCAFGFCGRDYNRYVPGIYWLNYFSLAYLRRMIIDLDGIGVDCDGTLVKMENGVLLRLYNKPTEWERCKAVVSALIDRLPNVFSIRDVEIPSGLYRKDSLSPEASPAQTWP